MLALATRARTDPGEHAAPTMRLAHRLQPLSAGVAVPLFALFSLGITLSGDVIGAALTSRIALGVALGLLVGKPLGVLAASWAATGLGLAHLPEQMSWRDMTVVGLLAGCGFTVSLLIAELAYTDSTRQQALKLAVLAASTTTAALAAALIRTRARHAPASNESS